MMNSKKHIPLNERFQSGEIVDLGSDICHVKLNRSIHGIQFARIRTDHLPEGQTFQDYSVGDRVPVFLLGPVQEFPETMHGSIFWGQRDTNPWVCSPPVVGELDQATAIRYIEPFGVFVRLDTGIDALLKVRDVPGGREDITQVIDIGDRMVILVTAVRKNTLEVGVSVIEALHVLHDRESERRAIEFQQPSIQLCSGQKLDLEGLQDISLVVLGPDRFFDRHLTQWLSDFGIFCITVRNPQDLSDTLEAVNHPTHVLAVTTVWSNKIQVEETARLLVKKNIKWLWLGTHPPFQGPAVGLPLNVGRLVQWLAEGVEPKANSLHKQPFTFSDYQLEHVQKLTNRLLERICSDLSIQGALWCRWERDGVYMPRAYWGLREEAVEDVQLHLGQTGIASTIELAMAGQEGDQPIIRSVSSSGPMRMVAPEDSDMICFLPLPYVPLHGEEETTRAIAFFYRQAEYRDSRDLLLRLKPYVPAMQAMIDALHFAYHNEMVSTFASLGVNSAAYLHELGQAALPIKEFLEKATQANRVPSPEEWRVLKKELTTLLRLTKSDLSVIRRRQGVRISISQHLAAISKLFKFRAGPIDCAFQVVMPDHPMSVSMPALLFDQVINNLLDNAFYFVENLPINSPRIEIRCDFDARNWSRPLVIDIIDNGQGVRASMQDKIFRMRDSEKEIGTGMGLFIVKSYLNAVGGEIVLRESIRWKQTIFRISLPILLDRQVN